MVKTTTIKAKPKTVKFSSDPRITQRQGNRQAKEDSEAVDEDEDEEEGSLSKHQRLREWKSKGEFGFAHAEREIPQVVAAPKVALSKPSPRKKGKPLPGKKS